MKFKDALNAILDGNRISRESWPDTIYLYRTIKDISIKHNPIEVKEICLLMKTNKSIIPWHIRDSDEKAEDWIIIKES